MFGPSAGSIRDTGYTDILDRINLNGVNSRSLAGKKRKNKAWHSARLIRHVSPHCEEQQGWDKEGDEGRMALLLFTTMPLVLTPFTDRLGLSRSRERRLN